MHRFAAALVLFPIVVVGPSQAADHGFVDLFNGRNLDGWTQRNGTATYRVEGKGAETLKAITHPARFKSWFHKHFGRFADQEGRLPFDQHFMRALVAPRPVLSTDGRKDLWANPRGTQAAWMAAQPVYDFLGASQNNMIHFREGGHDQLPEDFAILLDFADLHFRGKATTQGFRVPAERDLDVKWSWKAPAPIR